MLTAGFQVMEDFQGVQGFPQNACNAGRRVSVVLTAGFQVTIVCEMRSPKEQKECRFKYCSCNEISKSAGFQQCAYKKWRVPTMYMQQVSR